MAAKRMNASRKKSPGHSPNPEPVARVGDPDPASTVRPGSRQARPATTKPKRADPKDRNLARVTFRPIGVLRSPHTRPEATPIQPVYAGECLGRAELRPEFADGLTDLEGFSHV
jgi:hypothetical protein